MAAQAKPEVKPYDAPGWADDLDEKLLRRWDATIRKVYETEGQETLFLGLENSTATLATPFFKLDADATAPLLLAKWSADPLAPVNCVGLERATELCDWGLEGRMALHQEYCEARVVCAMDGDRHRPKRVEVTTELRDYWLCVAQHDPRKVQEMALEVLGFRPSWDDLYGTNPRTLDTAQRRRAFARRVAGRAEDDDLQDLPAEPDGPLNTEHLLFMTFRLNGLKNLLQILLLSAHRYATAGADPRPADAQVIFKAIGDASFACRRADPALMAEGQDAALRGDELILANPPGVYILGFTSEVFRYRDQPLPAHWIKPSRGRNGLSQRLEVGPPDDEAAFLDEIVDTAEQRPLTGCFQILRQVEVGVRLLRRTRPELATEPFQFPGTEQDPTSCADPERCREVLELLDRLRHSAGTSPACR